MSIKSEELLTWYLAMLRKNVREDVSSLTPMTLVETDHQLVQEIVAGCQTDQRERSQQALSLLKEKNKDTRNLARIVQVSSWVGCVAAVLILAFVCCRL